MLALVVSLMMTSFEPSVLTIPIEPIDTKVTQQDLYAIASSSAERYGLTEQQNLRLHRVVGCESGWVATSTGKLGERGLAQIYPKYHPEITEAQMIDPYFSLDFLARNLYKHTSWWSCYDLLFGD